MLDDNIVVDRGRGTVFNNDPLMIAAPQTITGNFDQSTNGILDLEFAPTQFGSITLKGPDAVATLAGGLDLVMTDGFAFMTGQTFDVLNYTSLARGLGFDGVSFFGHACTGTSTDVWTCGRGPIFEELFGSSSLDLDVLRGVPELSTWALLATGFLGLAGLGLMRRTQAA